MEDVKQVNRLKALKLGWKSNAETYWGLVPVGNSSACAIGRGSLYKWHGTALLYNS